MSVDIIYWVLTKLETKGLKKTTGQKLEWVTPSKWRVQDQYKFIAILGKPKGVGRDLK